jgi:hypothetical protein
MSISLDIEEHEPKLAVTSFISNYNKSKVLVSYSIGGLQQATDNQLVNNASVVLSQGDDNYELIHTDKDGIYQLEETIDFVSNKEYTLSVDAPSYTSISSKQLFPKDVAIIDATIDDERIKVKFKDTANQDNYYIIDMQAFHPEYNFNSYLYIDEESSFQESSFLNGILISDETFDGNEIELNINYNTYVTDGESEDETPSKPTSVKIILYSITEDVYKFDISYRNNFTDDPFTEPVILHRNIENGYGIFGMMNASIFEIDLTE